MGIFRQLKDMRDMVNAAPGLMADAQQMASQAQQMAAAQQAAARAQLAGTGNVRPGGQQPGAQPAGPDFESVSGVSLEQFAAVSKAVAGHNYDGSLLPQIAASTGIPAAAWESAAQGWNDRIRANPAVARHFNLLYRLS